MSEQKRVPNLSAPRPAAPPAPVDTDGDNPVRLLSDTELAQILEWTARMNHVQAREILRHQLRREQARRASA